MLNNKSDQEINENFEEDLEFVDTDSNGDEKTLKDKLKDLKLKLKEKTDEAKNNLDGWQRARAELVNKEKQLATEKIEMYKQASANILEELLPVLDSYEMAKRNKQSWEKVEANWRMGVEYIFAQLQKVVEDNGLKTVAPKIGEKFDVNSMHAIEEVGTDDENKDHTVSEIIQCGYELNGKLLREAKVKIYIKK